MLRTEARIAHALVSRSSVVKEHGASRVVSSGPGLPPVPCYAPILGDSSESVKGASKGLSTGFHDACALIRVDSYTE